ncbi:hypothetical protein SARC_02633 [Sphaeroforma arctica JP610]|uniref:Glycosyltransferase 61 catalytic domain-containing protein n=1 Tax=Sphaeroforma arctica JP610 TaxID=667725 RepID=A0A0L0G8H4_9EUKA|nr:hypothetical protein SARC_02633 [Sphaeroforma arctica JP610]KNC85176.1 hypothetical protein SARC_02633 [Sphaeroforma arctica JP610]|eukprot:XP_014159078.1 hypothetical protein SARC_02633 [Sphaeroforma arctica JP610]
MVKVQPSTVGRGLKFAFVVTIVLIIKITSERSDPFRIASNLTGNVDAKVGSFRAKLPLEQTYDVVDDRRAPHYRPGMDRLEGKRSQRKSLMDSSSSCDADGKLVCTMKNVCVDHTNKNRIVVLNWVPYLDKAHKLFWDLGDKGHPELDVEVKKVTPTTDVTYINGTTHFFHERYRNRLHLTMNVFAMRHFVEEQSPNRAFNLMLMDDLPFKYDPYTEPVLQMYRSITKENKVYFRDNAIGHQGTKLTCFERGVFGADREIIVPVIKPAMQHLHEFLAHKNKMIADSHATKWRARAERIQVHAETLKTAIPDFKRTVVANMNLTDSEWDPKEALLIFRGPTIHGARSDPPYRVIVNEDEVIGMLERNGFHINRVDFAEMTHMEQILNSRRAGLFIGMHGAGMANSFWTNEKAVVLELHTYGFQKWGYETLNNYAGTKYLSWVNTNENNTVPTWHSQSEKYNNDPDGRNQLRSRDQFIPIEELEPLVLEAVKYLDQKQ